ncbi:MAG: Tim44 domain-containing protein [Alphaproteobacteria bacterium]|nr:Tim44 domain-containing protein [Alphaproteobacteria bacterium]
MSAATFFMLLIFGLVLYAAYKTFKDDPPEPMPSAGAKKCAYAKPISNLAADKPEPGPAGINMGARITDNMVEVMRHDANFAPQRFLEDARDTFAKTLAAFEAGKIDTMSDRLSASILAHLEASYAAAAKSKKFPKTEIVRFKRVSIKDTRTDKNFADIDVLFETEQTAVITDAKGKIIEGDENQILMMSDIWTFSRDLRSNAPWVLSAIKAEEIKEEKK